MDKKLRNEVIVRDRARCRGCAQPGEEVHHMIFRSHGGADELANLVTICRNCHDQAHGKRQAPLPAWVLQAMIQYNKWRVCCSIWKHFERASNCSTCDNRSTDYHCLLNDTEVSREDGCDQWVLRSLKVHS